MKYIKRLFLVLLCIISLISPSYAQTRSEPSKPAAKIGILLPLSGQYSAFGLDYKQGIEIARSEIDPALNLDFIYADTRGDAALAVTEYRKLLDVNKVIGVFAGRGPVCMALNPLSKSAKLPLLGGVSNKDFAISNEYAFQFWSKSDVEGEAQARVIKEKGFSSVALITAQEDYNSALSEGVRRAAGKLGLKLVFDEEVLPSETDFRSQIGKIRRSQPQIIIMNIALSQIVPLSLQLRQQGLNLPAVSNVFAGVGEVAVAGGEAVEGLMFLEMSTDLLKLKADLKSKFKSSPSGATLAGYVATNMIAQALKGLKDINAATFYSSLSSVREVRTQNGNFEVKDRVVQFPLVLRVVRQGQPQDL